MGFSVPMSASAKIFGFLGAFALQKMGPFGAFLSFSQSVLPHVLTRFVKSKIRSVAGYYGDVSDVAVHPLQRRIILSGLSFERITSSLPVETISIESVILEWNWRYLMKGCIVGRLLVDQPIVGLHIPQPIKTEVPEEPVHLRRSLQKLWKPHFQAMPLFRLNDVVIQKGTVYLERNGSSKTVLASDLHLNAKNITNNVALSTTLLATGECNTALFSNGRMQLKAQGYPFAESPTFNADLSIEDVNVSDVAFLFEDALGVSLKGGKASLYGEGAAAEGRFKGYVKPMFEHLEIEPCKKGFFAYIKAGLAKLMARFLCNQKTDQIATRVEFEGRFDNPRIDAVSAITTFIRNAFFSALRPNVESRVGLSHSRGYGNMKINYQNEKKSRFTDFAALLKESWGKWLDHDVLRMSASLSYYTVFSVAPLLILMIAIAGFVFGREAAQGQIVGQINDLVGQQSAEIIESMIQAANKPAKGALASILGILSLLVGASGVLSELKTALNKIWQVKEISGLGRFVRERARLFGLILGIGFLLLVSLIASAAVSAAGKWFAELLPLPEFVLQTLNIVVSLGVITVLFAFLFKYLPNIKVTWHDMWLGSFVTAVLFTLGKSALGLYLGKGAVGSSYGAAGSVLIFLLWVYYSGLIFYFGAEFTKVYAEHHGSRAGKN